MAGATPRTLVIATTNRAKLEEFRSLLHGLSFDVRGLGEVLSSPPRVVEDGATFADNAMKKALAVATASGMLALADDSGLEVEALGGRPGVRSARFAGEKASDAENNAALIAELDRIGHVGPAAARFRCALALVDPDSKHAPCLAEGTCDGTITRTPRGARGFGYDALFVVAGANKTMAELTGAEKNRISHRARAVDAMQSLLRGRSSSIRG